VDTNLFLLLRWIFSTLAKNLSSFWRCCRGLLNHLNFVISLLFMIFFIYIFVYILKKKIENFFMIYALHFYFFVLCYWKASLCFVATWGSRSLVDSKEINILCYEKWMISLHIKDLEARLSMNCDFCGGYHSSYYCEEQFIDKEEEQEVVNINYNSQLQIILDELLMSNRDWFEKFDVQFDDLVEKAYESQKKLIQMETDCHDIMVEENPQVKSVGFFSWSFNQWGIKKPLMCKAVHILLYGRRAQVKRFSIWSMGASAYLYEVHGIPTKQEE